MSAHRAARRARAAVARGGAVAVEEILVEPPRATEVMIEVAACGVCHSDWSAVDGTLPLPQPLVLGHEGAGVVVEIGVEVRDFALGDHVVTSFVSMCGECRYCIAGRPSLCDQAARTVATLPDGSVRTHGRDGEPLGVFCGCGVMAERATLDVDNVIKIDASVPLERAALFGCAVTTGVGAVVNTARVRPGATVAVLGVGGVGLNVVQGSRLAGASEIVAIDTVAAKLELARMLGATATIDARGVDDVVKAIKRLTRGGVDYAFECVGRGETAAQAFASLRKGGTAVVVGVAAQRDVTPVRTVSLTLEEKTLTGSYFGSARPREDIPRLLALYCAGRLDVDALVTRSYSIEEAPAAFADLTAGRNARGVIVF